jgi:hypothetical protein
MFSFGVPVYSEHQQIVRQFWGALAQASSQAEPIAASDSWREGRIL